MDSCESIPARRFVVVGGGIAGVTCALELSRLLGLSETSTQDTITLIAPAKLKVAQTLHKHSRFVEEYEVSERSATELFNTKGSNRPVEVVADWVVSLDTRRKVLLTSSGCQVGYTHLCLCTGARPAVVALSPHVLSLRDTESVEVLARRLTEKASGAAGEAQRRRKRIVMVVGNGAIALELVQALARLDRESTSASHSGVRVLWVVKDTYIGNTFFDRASSAFLIPRLFPVKDPDVHSSHNVPGGSGAGHASVVPIAAPDITQPEVSAASEVLPSRQMETGSADTVGSDAQHLILDTPMQRRPRKARRFRGKGTQDTPAAHHSDESKAVAPMESVGDGAKGYIYRPSASRAPKPPPPAMDSGVDDTRHALGGGMGPSWVGHLRQSVGCSVPAGASGVAGSELTVIQTSEPLDEDQKAHHASTADAVDAQSWACNPDVQLLFNNSVDSVEDLKENSNGYNVRVVLIDGSSYEIDFMVSATGVVPNTEVVTDQLRLSEDGSIEVDERLQSSVESVFAAGDCACVPFSVSGNHAIDLDSNWFQMRLWGQARLMGQYAAATMCGVLQEPGIEFDLFTHATRFFGFKVILLGRYNAQGLGANGTTGVENKDYHVLMRIKPGVEFVKLVLVDWRLVGAVLIGETDLEETFENLILNGLDLSHLGDALLDESVDLEDYFD